MPSDINELWEKLGENLVEQIDSRILAKLEQRLESFIRSEINLVFTETEAAEKLSVSKKTMENYRKLKLIDHYHYPPSIAGTESGKNPIYGYSLKHLEDFLERNERKILRRAKR